MSWSCQREVAAHIAQRRADLDQKHGGVYFAELPADAILHIVRGGEEEYVIDPIRLPVESIRLVETLEPVPPSEQERQLHS